MLQTPFCECFVIFVFCKCIVVSLKLNYHLFETTGHNDGVNCLVVSPDCREIFSGSYDGTVRRWLVQTGQCLHVYQVHSNTVCCVALLPNGSIASGSSDGIIKIWNSLTGECLQTLKGNNGYVSGITVCSNGDLVGFS